MPEGAEVVMPWRKIERINPGDPGTPAYGFATDGTELYVNFFEVVVKMPLAGGSVTEVFRSSNELTLGIKSFQDSNGMVLLDSGQWTRIPFGGGAPQALSLTLPLGSTVFDFDPATDSVWAELNDFSAKTVAVIKGNVDSGAIETILAPQPQSKGEFWYRAGERFFSQGEPTGGERPLLVAQQGGTSEPFPTTPASGLLIGATKNFLYYQSSAFTGDDAGAFRVPLAGGASERVYQNFIPGASYSWRDDSTLYINDASYIVRFSEVGEARRVTPVPTGACTSHGVLVHDGYVYVATFGSTSGENQIWRIKE
jgi:hypothetical protein